MAWTEEKAEILQQKYQLGKLLGHGAFAKVYHARNIATSQSVAIKVIDKNELVKAGMARQIKREISIMRMVKHPNIIQLHEVMATKSKIFFIMEYAKGGELFNELARGRLPESTARSLFHQLVQAVQFCHSRGIFHRDLKPENLLLDECNNLKISDFGLGALAESTRSNGLLHTACGTPAYVAPEVIRMKGYDGAKSDVWSCGIILFVLLAGYLPFREHNLMELYSKISRAEFKFPAHFSAEARNLLSRILDPNPSSRISIPDIVEASWFREGTSSTATTASTVITSLPVVTAAKPATAFEIISLAPGLDLSGMFEDGVEAKTGWFVSSVAAATILSKLEMVAAAARLKVVKKDVALVRMEGCDVSIEVEIFEIHSGLVLVEVKLASGDRAKYQRLWSISIWPSLQEIVCT